MTTTAADPFIPFEAIFNFRDVGFLTTRTGQAVRPGKLFRSDTLHRLTEADAPAFAALNVREVVDLRRPDEVADMGRIPEWAGANWRHHHLEHPLWDHETFTPGTDVARWLADRYAELAEHGAADIASVIAVLASLDCPAVVHCVAGKDRTGLVIALALELLGVPDEQIAEDYALTARGVADFWAWFTRKYPERATDDPPPFYTQTPAEAMLLTLASLRERYGSVESYLVAAGLAPDAIPALRHHLTE